MRSILRFAIFALALATLASGGTARAQGADETARARALFDEGVALFDGGRLDEAEVRFRASLEIRDSQSVRFNLASVLARRGRLLEAAELFAQVAASAQVPAEVRADASGRIDELQPRLARLTLTVPESMRGATVRLDDRALSPEELGAPIATDPGVRSITVARGQTVLMQRSLRLGEGESRTLALAVASPSEAAGTVVSPNGSEGPVTSGDSEPIWLYVVVGIAIAALIGGGIAIGVVADEGRYFSGNVGPGRITVP
jgi:hypothetical protein